MIEGEKMSIPLYKDIKWEVNGPRNGVERTGGGGGCGKLSIFDE